MQINIKIDEGNVTVKAGKKMLEIRNDSPSWNTTHINEFLIHCSSIVDKGEKLELSDKDEAEDNLTYKHVYKLFNIFVEQYNSI